MPTKKNILILSLVIALVGAVILGSFSIQDEDGSSMLANLIAGVKVKRVRDLNSSEIKELIGVVDNLNKDLKDHGFDYSSSYYSKNTSAQISNYLKIQKGSSNSDSPQKFKDSLLQLRWAQILPLGAIEQKSIIKATQASGVRKIIEKFEGKYQGQKHVLFRCSAFVKEGTWKVQSAEKSNIDPVDEDAALAFVTHNCYQQYPEVQDLSSANFYDISTNFSSEYSYIVYLNNNLIAKGDMGGGLSTLKLPLNKGKNELIVVLGVSEKDFFKKDDPMIQLVKDINGFNFNLSEANKSIIDIKADKGTQTIKKEFDY